METLHNSSKKKSDNGAFHKNKCKKLVLFYKKYLAK